MAPVGSLIAGWAAEHAGPPIALGACGILALAAAGVYASRLGAIRREIRPVYERLGA